MKYHVPTVEVIISHLGWVFRRETASGFCPWRGVGEPSQEGDGGIVWFAAWKRVSIDDSTTVHNLWSLIFH